MADFTVRLRSGASLTTWLDPVGPANQPSRVNPHAGHPHKRWRGTVGVTIELAAVVAGVEAPLDGTLGGRLFVAWCVQAPGGPYVFTSPAGNSAVQRLLPRAAGHYALGMRRPDGGLEHVHVDVVHA